VSIAQHDPLVSIIVPTYNEAADIVGTLDALSTLRYRNKEVIVVDDASADSTVERVSEYVRRFGFKLTRQPANRGVAAARNEGIRQAAGEIVVILNADVSPDPDFLDRIVPHYRQTCDYLLVESCVANQERLFPRFIEAEHHFLYDGQAWINWTEGFSCRRSAALAVGLFPEQIPGASGEDAVFGERLERRFRKVIDKSIVVHHIAPATLSAYWKQRLGRGRGISFRQFFLHERSLWDLSFLAFKVTARALVDTIMIVPIVRRARHVSRCSPRGRADWLRFTWATLIERWGETLGMWMGVAYILGRRPGRG
jgi:glycosyltransferase involved in cell wall biosynthesis